MCASGRASVRIERAGGRARVRGECGRGHATLREDCVSGRASVRTTCPLAARTLFHSYRKKLVINFSSSLRFILEIGFYLAENRAYFRTGDRVHKWMNE